MRIILKTQKVNVTAEQYVNVILTMRCHHQINDLNTRQNIVDLKDDPKQRN